MENNELLEDVLRKNIFDQVKNRQINLTDFERDYLNKVSLFTYESLSLINYSAGLPYLSKTLKLLMGNNKENILKNPFFKILTTLENALFNQFILLFANLFTKKYVKEDTFSIRSLFRTIGKMNKGKIVIDSKLPNLIDNNDESKETLEKVLLFFDDDENSKTIDYYLELRNKVIAHPTINRNFSGLGNKLNHFIIFLLELNDLLYKLLGLNQIIDFEKLYKDEVANWGFMFETVKKNVASITSDDLTNEIVSAYEEMKEKTYKKNKFPFKQDECNS